MDSGYSPDQPQRYASQSSHEKSSQSQTHNRKLFIQRNSQQQQEIVIPYWDEQSSSAHYHLIEEIRLLKKKNAHFESHMGRMKAEYEQLRINLEIMDQNQKDHIRRFAELTQRYNIAIAKIQQLKAELEFIRNQNADLKGDLRVKDLREEENRKKINKLKDQEGILNSKIMELESELKLGTFRSEEEKRILQKSRQAQLQMLKYNLQGQDQKPGVFAQVIAQLKANIDQRDFKIRNLEKECESMQEKLNKIRDQKKQIPNFDTHSHSRQIETLKYEISQMRVDNMKASEERNKLLTQINSLQLQKQEMTKRIQDLAMKKRNQLKIMDSVELTIVGSRRVQQANVKSKEAELGQELTRKQALIKNMLQKLHSLEERLGEKEKQANDKIKRLEEELDEKQEQIVKLRISLQAVESGNGEKRKMDQRKQRQGKQGQRKQGQQKQQRKQREVDEVERTLSNIEMEYNNELQALRRLILYKKYSSSNNEAQNKVRQEYQHKFDLLVSDYQQLQKQLLVLQEELLHHRHLHRQQEDTHKQVITFRTSEEERIVYLQAIRKWEIAYEQLHAIYEAKLVSKDEQINLLNLRLANRADHGL